MLNSEKKKKMNNMRFSISILAIIIVAILVGEIKAQEITVASIHIVRIIEQDEKAMIKLPDGRMHILKVGDSIGKNGKVIEIVEGRIVIEERTEKGPETVIIRFDNGKQKIERIRKVGDRQPVLYSPSTKGTKGHEGTRRQTIRKNR
jgi:hypothetical protein